MNEVVDYAKKRRKECLNFKVNFEKAYNSVSWSFLGYMLGALDSTLDGELGFGHLFYLETCMSWSMGVRQRRLVLRGDSNEVIPLLFFLFLLVVEGFNGLMHIYISLLGC